MNSDNGSVMWSGLRGGSAAVVLLAMIASCTHVPSGHPPKACYVAVQGSDQTGDGTFGNPFRTLAKATSTLVPGDTCYLRAGRYREGLVLDSIQGRANEPITFAAYPGERAVLDGTVPITSTWIRHKGNIYKTRIDQDIWQLFLDGETLTTARFPDASWDDGSIWDLKASCRHLAAGSKLGLMVDERPPSGDAGHGPAFDEGAEEGWARLADDVNQVTLAASGIDFSGAVAVMHIGSWLSWAQTVDAHAPGSDRFTYSSDFSKSGVMAKAARLFIHKEAFFTKKNLKVGQGYYFLEGLQCLDRPGEWYYTPGDQTLYLYAPDGKDPNGRDLCGKVRTYSVEGTDCAHVAIRGMTFFGATFRFIDSHHVLVEDCRFDYPSFNKLVLGDYRRPEVSGFVCGREPPVASSSREDSYASHDNVLRNCTFRRMDGPALDIQGRDNTVENCLFSEIDYTCLGTGAEGSINMSRSTGTIFRRNTIRLTGNSEGIRGGARNQIEFNHVHHMSLIQHDGSQINLGVAAQDGTVLRNNWSHDSVKASLRFDSAGMGSVDTVTYGVRGRMENNVAWRSGAMKVKGDEHIIVGNTGLWGVGQNGVTMTVLDNASMGGVNVKSTTKNNIGVLSGHFRFLQPLPGNASHNQQVVEGDALAALLRDPANRDFRPRAGSPLIDAGTIVSGVTDDYIGNAPDIGAYEHGAKQYWIPGYQTSRASHPIPPAGATGQNAGRDLIWLGGYGGTSYNIYFGSDARAVAAATEHSDLFQGNQANNIFMPTYLPDHTKWYWRVDTVTPTETVKGAVWHYSTAPVRGDAGRSHVPDGNNIRPAPVRQDANAKPTDRSETMNMTIAAATGSLVLAAMTTQAEGGNEAKVKYFQNWDQDGDGYHSLAEHTASVKAGFAKQGKKGYDAEAKKRVKRKDANADGKLSLKEFLSTPKPKAAGTKQAAKPTADKKTVYFQKWDTDGDGYQSLQELTASIKSGFEKQGKTGYEAEAKKRLGRKDTDGDGKISLKEHLGT